MSGRPGNPPASVPEIEPEIESVQRRTLRVVMFSQVLGGAGLAAGVTVGALLAEELLGSTSLSGLPSALFTLGSALAAYLVGRLAQRSGRRLGLGFGFIAGGVGAAGAVLAAVIGNVALLFVSLFIYGAGSATNLQARYAGTDLASPATRGKAVSVALVSTTVGAVAGPNLVDPLGRLAGHFGIPPLAGPFLLACVAYLAAGLVLLVLLRPDPLLLARRLVHETGSGATPSPSVRPGRWSAETILGASVMAVTQIAMVAIMTMTPVHMAEHHHGLAQVGLVISAHIAAMYLPSPFSGYLVDRWGRLPVAIGAGIALLAAGLCAALAPGENMPLLILALMLLGLGWNLGLVSGTALVVDGTEAAVRARVQGTIDVLVALAGAVAGLLSGVLMAATSYAGLSLTGGLLSVVLVLVLAWSRRAVSGARETAGFGAVIGGEADADGGPRTERG